MYDPELKATPLYPHHVALGARMVPFAGYAMPVQYPTGVLAEHRWTRKHAGLFDVSHMGPAFVIPVEPTGDVEADWAIVAGALERLVCGDILGLKPGQLRYTLLLNDEGGIVDDLMVGRHREPEHQGHAYVVVNAFTKDADYARIEAAGGGAVRVVRADAEPFGCALIAVQGPEAVEAVAAVLPEAAALSFMSYRRVGEGRDSVFIARSGYTGEDGYEILLNKSRIAPVWDALTADPRVRPVGLGARDSLRLEAGLPLYGHDLDPVTSPVEAGLRFAVSKRRREAADFPGADRILREWAGELSRVRVGLRVTGAPAREGAEIVDAAGSVVGNLTSGGPSPSAGGNIAMGYVPPALSAVATPLQVMVRGRAQPAEVVALPFLPHRYVRKA